MRDRSRLRRLSARLAGGHPVRWDQEEAAAATDEERAAIRELRVVAAMSAFNEAVQSEGEAPDLGSSISIGRSIVAGPSTGPAPKENGSPSLPPGTRWGHLEILEWIGQGAFGEVYRARDTRLDRIVALKMLAGEASSTGDEVIREARLMARVRHPHVVTVHGADRIDGRVGIWMEYLEGETLNRLLKQRGSLDAREAALIGIDLCRALSAVHAAGIAHRDVKLANAMRAKGGRIVLMDFGLGREAPRGGRRRSRKLSGTPLFMAPEVLLGGAEDARSDVYSLGVVLFALVTGSLPVEASSFSDLLARHERHEARRARDLRPDLPESFAQVLERALDPDPATRLQTAGEAEKALLHSLGAAVLAPAAEVRGRGRRWIVLTLGAAALVLVAAGVWMKWPRHPSPEIPRPSPFRALPDLTIVGEEAGALFGLEVAGLGDVDRDGFDDVFVGAPLSANRFPYGGRVFLYRGGRDGLDPKPAWTMTSPDSGSDLGRAIAPFTDLNLDGFADLVIGAPGTTERHVGRVFVFLGSRSGPATEPDQVIHGTREGGFFGSALSSGDVNHDSSPDLLVGEPGHPVGRAYLFMSRGNAFDVRPAWTYAGPESSGFGVSLALGGDLNNDGYADAVIGASEAGAGRSEYGATYVFLGSATGLDTIPTILHGRQPGSLFGRDVFFAGDVDADGFQDLCIGAEGASNGESREGAAEIYFGSRAGVSPYGAVFLEPNVMGANFGGHAGPLGDVDGDGCDDLFVGALRYQRTEPRAGAAFIFSGSRRRAIQRSWLRVGSKGGSWYGGEGGAAGDVNGDGFPDLVIAGPSWDTKAGSNVGMVEVFLNTRRR